MIRGHFNSPNYTTLTDMISGAGAAMLTGDRHLCPDDFRLEGGG
jgi:hypothetical protein